jgi:multiple sugar transport system ATP-binding protein
MVELSLDSVTKRYDDAQGTETAVDDLSLTVEDELLVLLGPSGCGKTTTLRMIAGLETVTSGTITIGDRDVTDLHPSDRSIAMVFQDYGLYTTMSVRQNMAYGLKHSTNLSADERDERVESMAEMFDIADLLGRDIDQLSGGQKQRVSLGRAMVREPDVFLLDEPLASLDAKLRSEMRTELQQLQQDLDITTVYVTHDQKEAMTMGDKVAVLDDGVLRQLGDPETVYSDPADRFVADFLGNPSMNQFETTVHRDDSDLAFEFDGVVLARLPADAVLLSDGDDAVVGLRPENLHLSPADATGGEVTSADGETTPDGGRTDGDRASNGGADDEGSERTNPDDRSPGFVAEVGVTEYQGNDNFVHLRLGETELTAVVPPSVAPNAGDRVVVSVAPDDVYVFDAETGTALTTAGGQQAER